MTVVVDASVIAYFAMPDEGGDETHPLYSALASAAVIAPRIYWYEIRNIALKKERQARLTASRADEILRSLDAIPIALREIDDSEQIVAIARRHALSFYDASYLALALAESAVLATLDAKLMRAAKAEGVLLEP